MWPSLLLQVEEQKESNQQAKVPGLTPVEALGLGWPGYEAYAFGQVALSQ